MDYAIGALLGELDRLADRARHPALTLDRFTDDYRDGPSLALRPEQELLARRRRAAVIYAPILRAVPRATVNGAFTVDHVGLRG